MGKYVFWAVFAAAAAVQIAAILLRKPGLQAVSKALLLPSLLGAYVTGTETPLAPVVIAAAAGWAGDLFLIRAENPLRFRLGLVSFLAGHVCYLLAIQRFAGGFSPVLAAGALYFAAGAAVYRWVKPAGDMRVPVIVYEAVIMLMSLCALNFLALNRGPAALLVFAGSLAFLVSDSLLARFIFNAKPGWGDLAVMGSYMAAQAAIIRGLMILSGNIFRVWAHLSGPQARRDRAIRGSAGRGPAPVPARTRRRGGRRTPAAICPEKRLQTARRAGTAQTLRVSAPLLSLARSGLCAPDPQGSGKKANRGRWKACSSR